MRKRIYSEPTIPAAPKFLPGDPVRDVEDDEEGTVEFARSDGMVCVAWSSARREWVHEDMLQWAPGFQPTRRPRISER